MFLTFLGPPISLMIYSTVAHQKLPFFDPTHLFDDVILEWSLSSTVNGHNLPPLVDIGLINLAKPGWAVVHPAHPSPTAL